MEQPQHILRANARGNKTPMQRVSSVGIVALLHIGAILAVSIGLATQLMQKLPEPIVADVAPPPPPKDVPPPPPPETVKPPPPPVVPPPDIVIQQDVAPPQNTITVAVAKPQAAPANPMEGVTLPASVGKGHNCAQDFYPSLSARMHEEGTTVLSFVIQADGNIKDVAVKTSSGKARLDQAALECAKGWKYKPAMKEGQPVEVPWTTNVVWKLQ